MSTISYRRCKGTFTCKYLSFYDPKLKRNFRLPLVHIRLKNKDNSIRTDALVDSGATATFIPIELAEILELELPEKTSDAVGAGGTFSTYACEIDQIDVLKGTRIFCSIKNMRISIPKKLDVIPHSILGRDSIFWKNDITFRERKQHTIFRDPKKDNAKKIRRW